MALHGGFSSSSTITGGSGGAPSTGGSSADRRPNSIGIPRYSTRETSIVSSLAAPTTAREGFPGPLQTEITDMDPSARFAAELSNRAMALVEAHKVGVPLIDNQHQRLFELAEELKELMLQQGSSSDAIVKAIHALTMFTAEHFATEELLMRVIGYPGEQRHALAHFELMQQLYAAIKQVTTGNLDVKQAAEYTERLLIDHTRKEDGKIEIYCRKHRLNLNDMQYITDFKTRLNLPASSWFADRYWVMLFILLHCPAVVAIGILGFWSTLDFNIRLIIACVGIVVIPVLDLVCLLLIRTYSRFQVRACHYGYAIQSAECLVASEVISRMQVMNLEGIDALFSESDGFLLSSLKDVAEQLKSYIPYLPASLLCWIESDSESEDVTSGAEGQKMMATHRPIGGISSSNSTVQGSTTNPTNLQQQHSGIPPPPGQIGGGGDEANPNPTPPPGLETKLGSFEDEVTLLTRRTSGPPAIAAEGSSSENPPPRTSTSTNTSRNRGTQRQSLYSTSSIEGELKALEFGRNVNSFRVPKAPASPQSPTSDNESDEVNSVKSGRTTSERGVTAGATGTTYYAPSVISVSGTSVGAPSAHALSSTGGSHPRKLLSDIGLTSKLNVGSIRWDSLRNGSPPGSFASFRVHKNSEAILNQWIQRKSVTILACTIKDFHDVTVTLNTHELLELINKYIGMVEEICKHTKAVFNSMDGDQLILSWNAQKNVGNHAEQACNTALKLREEFSTLTSDRYKLSIGISTSSVLVGNLGSKTKLGFSILGPFCRFVESLCELNSFLSTEILVCWQTWKEVQNFYFGKLICPVDQNRYIPLPVAGSPSVPIPGTPKRAGSPTHRGGGGGGGSGSSSVVGVGARPLITSSETPAVMKHRQPRVFTSTLASRARTFVVELQTKIKPDTDEWMYAIAQASMKDPYADYNSVVSFLFDEGGQRPGTAVDRADLKRRLQEYANLEDLPALRTLQFCELVDFASLGQAAWSCGWIFTSS